MSPDANQSHDAKSDISPDIPGLRNQEERAQSESGGLYNPSGDTENTKEVAGPQAAGVKDEQKTGAVGAATQGIASAATPTSGIGKTVSFFWGGSSRKKKTVGGGIVAVIVAAFFGFSILSGPLQLVHLSEQLKTNFASSQQASANRGNKLFRYANSSGDLAETRVGLLGKKYLKGTITSLADLGVEFQSNSLGALKSTTIDTKKLAKKYPELDGMNRAQQRAWLADRYDGLAAKQISYSKGKFVIDGGDFTMKTTSLLQKNSVALTADGSIDAALKNRILAKFFDIPSLFHPLKRAVNSKLNRTLNAKEQKAQQDAEEAREKATIDPVEAKADAAVKNIEDESNKYNSPVMKTLLLTGGACFVRGIAGDVVTVNRDRIVAPAVIRSIDLIAVGEQIKSGQDFDIRQLGAVEKSLTNSAGKTVWQSKPLQATERVSNPSGPDLPEDYRQAFSSKTTSGTIKGWANKSLGGSTSASVLCSPLGQLAQVVVTLGASAASAFGEVASGGALTPAIAGAWAAKESVAFAISAVAMHFVESFVLSQATHGSLAKEAFSGPIGGGLLAYGGREAANIGSRAEGGVALSSTDSSKYTAMYESQQRKTFESESLASRLFDTHSTNSLMSQVALSISPSWKENVSNGAQFFASIGTTLPKIFSFLSSPVHAASQTYDWGFPQYGIPSSVLDDESMANPYKNANQVASVLDGSSGNGYISRAQDCFGVEISKESGAWDVSPSSEVNPAEEDYGNARCDDLSDPNWKRVMLFVFDTRTMAATACYMGDDQSCSQEGIGSGSGSASSDTSSSVATGNAKDLAQQILANKKIDLTCYSTSVKQDVQSAAAGQPGTAGAMTSSAILKLIATLGKNHSVCVTAIQSNGQGHTDGSYHYSGDGVDFGSLDGATITGRNEPAITILKQAFDVLPSGTGVGQSACGVTPTLPSGWTTFDDSCNHLHLQVPRGTP
jgi:hypothetical protein